MIGCFNGLRRGPDRASAISGGWVGAVGLAVFMATLDSSIVGIALPTMRVDFEASPVTAEWVVLGYLLPLVGLSLPAGRWLNRVGPRRPALMVSTGGFVAASVAAGLAPGMSWLIAPGATCWARPCC